MKWLRDMFRKDSRNTPKDGSFAVPQPKSMDDVMRRVDAQIGRAVTRLADR